MHKVRKVESEWQYLSRGHDWKAGPMADGPHGQEPLCKCALCGAESIPSKMATQNGPGLCDPHWMTIGGLAPSLQAEIVSGKYGELVT